MWTHANMPAGLGYKLHTLRQTSASDRVVCRGMAQLHIRTHFQQPQLCSGSMAKSSKVKGQATIACNHAPCVLSGRTMLCSQNHQDWGILAWGVQSIKTHKGVLKEP